MHFDASRTHKFDICLCRGVSVIEGAFFLCLAPEDLVVAVRIKRRVDINQVNTFVGEFFQLFEVIAAINDAGIDER